jgi:hypothetical protein
MTIHQLRTSFQYRRSVCRDFPERMLPGSAIRNGWSAEALTDLAEGLRRGRYGMTIKPQEYAYQRTIQLAAGRSYDAQEPFWRIKTVDRELTS